MGIIWVQIGCAFYEARHPSHDSLFLGLWYSGKQPSHEVIFGSGIESTPGHVSEIDSDSDSDNKSDIEYDVELVINSWVDSTPALIAPTETEPESLRPLRKQEARHRARFLGNPIGEALRVTDWSTRDRPRKRSPEAEPSAPLEIFIIEAAPFAKFAKDPKVELFAAIMADFEMA